MASENSRSFNSLVAHFLGGRLPERLAGMISFAELPIETRRFILRMLILMQQAGYPVTEYTPMLIRTLSDIIPNMLPGAWGGRIPPLTMPGRHQKFDTYVAKQTWPSLPETPVFVDIGCGFPPITTLDTAHTFPEWRVIGVDRDFAPYIVYDPDGNYACFDRRGRFQYFQPVVMGEGLALLSNLDRTKDRFRQIFADFSEMIKGKDPNQRLTLKKNGNRIEQHLIRDFETGNVTFTTSDVTRVHLPPAVVIRCMNMLVYAQKESRNHMLQTVSEFLGEGGVLIAGTNGNDVLARYLVYRKKNGQTAPAEFAFSPDNIRPFGIMPWFTIHDDDPEATFLAALTGAIRGDKEFWPSFSRRFDTLLSQYGIFHRHEDGFLHLPDEELSIPEAVEKMKQLWMQIRAEGYVDDAVNALERRGYAAWQNDVGDIAVEPPEGVFPVF